MWLIFVVILPTLFLILALIERNKHPSSSLYYFFLTVFVGSFFVSFVFTCLYIIKKNWLEYCQFTVPIIVMVLWILIYLPLLAIFPITVMFMQSDNAKLVNTYRITIGIVALLLLLAIMILAIIANLFFSKIDYEKKVKFVVAKMIKMLAKIHVKSDVDTIR